MPPVPHRQDADPGSRRAAYLELIAASAIFATIAVVLYLIFAYRPI
jgi:hypothetical protein